MKKNKLLSLITIVCFTGVIGALSIWNVLAPKRTVSWNENRTLAPAPSLSASHIFGGKFDDDFEKWFSDHFVERDFWIELKAAIRKSAMAIENNEIYFAKEGRLVQRFSGYEPDVLNSNIETINAFAESTDRTANILLVPSSVWGSASALPYGAWDIDQEALLNEIAPRFANQNFISYLDYASASPALYFHTDHHWNEQGAYLGYAAIAETVMHKQPEPFTYELASDDFSGTMYSRSGAFWVKADPIYTILPEKPVAARITFENGESIDSVFSEERLNEKDKYMYYADGNHPFETITTDVHNGKKAVIVKDSYSHILLPYLITEYETIDLIDLRYYRDPVSELLDESSDLYFIYSLDNFATDPNLVFLR